jgi:glycosyltransferase involved in cell wall biosynthesis
MSYAVIIPVLRLEGNPYLKGLLEALQQQSCKPAELHLVIGDKRQGRAINYGVSQAQSEVIATLDDDSFIDDVDLFKKLLDALASDESLGLIGAACEIPEWASSFQKKAMREIPRRWFPIQTQTVDSDMVQHPCLMMKKSFFEQIQGEDEELIRGLDPVLRKKVRDAGKRVAVIANTWVYHLLPDGLLRLMKMYFRNGRGSGYASRHFPERVLELSDGYDEGQFVEKRSLPFRIARRVLGLMKNMGLGKWVVTATDLAYACGVLFERISPTPFAQIPQVKSIKSEIWSEELDWVKVHRVELDEKKV